MANRGQLVMSLKRTTLRIYLFSNKKGVEYRRVWRISNKAAMGILKSGHTIWAVLIETLIIA
jgi:hypothetical protein